ncbi:siderophore ABC transporter substrate-binding protein [Sediminibacillus massiliensis]|uniref:siderophore ABC transporter substrate-binding protein n=1 Tax=Sediminibacillus massiliensis TaxID=1926277 RepID=UPI0009886148|nr:siderophore ABC transporter substrate-binding protein [Sediminibacillus massiliensis]
MKRNILFALVAAVLMILAACGTNDSGEASEATAADNETASENQETSGDAAEITVSHELGETVVPKNPENVVVFDFGALDILDSLGVEVGGVAKGSSLPDYLSEYNEDGYVNVGSLKEPDFEAINAMEPELIIISGRQSAAYEDLSEIAPTIYVGVDNENYMESFTNNVNTLAEIFDKEAEAETQLAKINDKISEVQEMTSDSEETGLVVLTTGGNLSAFGAGSRFGVIHDVFGVTPADENIETEGPHGMKVTFEYIAETNPDYLYIIDRDAVVGGDQAASEVFNNELVDKTNAAKNDKLIYLDPAVWYLSGGGLTGTAKQVDEVKEGLE